MASLVRIVGRDDIDPAALICCHRFASAKKQVTPNPFTRRCVRSMF